MWRKQLNTTKLTEKEKDLEAARQIGQALFNLPEDYPWRGKANEAFGRLILGRLGLVQTFRTKLPDEDNKWVLLEVV